MDLLLAQESASVGLHVKDLLQPEILVFMIPLAVIVAGCVLGVTKTVLTHRERIAMIENGLDPDAYRASDEE